MPPSLMGGKRTSLLHRLAPERDLERTFGLTNLNCYPAKFRQWPALHNAAIAYRDGTLALSR